MSLDADLVDDDAWDSPPASPQRAVTPPPREPLVTVDVEPVDDETTRALPPVAPLSDDAPSDDDDGHTRPGAPPSAVEPYARPLGPPAIASEDDRTAVMPARTVALTGVDAPTAAVPPPPVPPRAPAPKANAFPPPPRPAAASAAPRPSLASPPALTPFDAADDEKTVVKPSAVTGYDVVEQTPTAALVRSSSVPPPPPSVAADGGAPRALPPPPSLSARGGLPPPPRVPAFAPPPSAPTSSPTFAPAHAPPISRRPRASIPPPVTSGRLRSKMPTLAPTAESIPPPPSSLQRRRPVAAWVVGLGAVAAAAAAFVMRPTTGELVVSSASLTGGVSSVAVRVDGELRCESTPCTIKGLAPGMHLVQAGHLGEVAADRAVVVEAGQAVTHHVTVDAAETALAGLRVAASATGLRVIVDGRDRGSSPVSLDGLDAGEHIVRIESADGTYRPYEESITLGAGEVRNMSAVKLQLVKGHVRLEPGPGAEGAAVRVGDRTVLELPAVIDVDPTKPVEVVASRPGYQEFTQTVSFADGVAEQEVRVSLESDGAAPAYRARSYRRAPAAMRPAAVRKMPAAASGGTTMNLNSIPVATVILDGQVLGQTPVIGKAVSPGAHTAVFVGPDGQRKVVTAQVPAGGRKTAYVRF